MPAPNLRTRKSTADSRVTLFSLDHVKLEEASPPGPSIENLSSPSSNLQRSSRRRSAVKVEPQDDANAASVFATPRRKRSRTSLLKEETETEEDGADTKPTDSASSKGSKKSKKGAPASSPRPASPTKIRAKLEVAHPPPPRWRETYDIVSSSLNVFRDRGAAN